MLLVLPGVPLEGDSLYNQHFSCISPSLVLRDPLEAAVDAWDDQDAAVYLSYRSRALQIINYCLIYLTSMKLN